MVKLTAEAIAAGGLLALAAGYFVDEPKTRRTKASARHLLASMLLFSGGIAVAGGLGVLIDRVASHHPEGMS